MYIQICTDLIAVQPFPKCLNQLLLIAFLQTLWLVPDDDLQEYAALGTGEIGGGVLEGGEREVQEGQEKGSVRLQRAVHAEKGKQGEKRVEVVLGRDECAFENRQHLSKLD